MSERRIFRGWRWLKHFIGEAKERRSGMKPCSHHSYYHASCRECRKVNHVEDEEDNPIPSATPFTYADIPAVAPDPDPTPAPDPTPDTSTPDPPSDPGFSGGESGGGGAGGDF